MAFSNTEASAVVVVAVLHASPLRNKFSLSSFAASNLNGGEEVEEIADIEIDRERIEIKQALEATGRECVFVAKSLTRENFIQALQTAHILVLGAHGIQGGSLVLEANTFEGELLSAEELKKILLGMRIESIRTRFAFVSACYSEPIGRALLSEGGIPHVVTIAGDNRISNLVSRSFISRVLLALLLLRRQDTGALSVREAIESALHFLEVHPDLPANRRARQREKFIYLSKQKEDAQVLFADCAVTEGGGRVRDESAQCKLVGFPDQAQQRQAAWPIFGRQEMIQGVLSALLQAGETRIAVLKQQGSGLGSSLILRFVAHYLSTRQVFDTIELVTSFALASGKLQRADSKTLLLVDPLTSAGEQDFWLLVGGGAMAAAPPKFSAALLVVSKSALHLPPSLLPFHVDPLKPKYVLKFLDYLQAGGKHPPGGGDLPREKEEEGNPKQIILRAKTSRLTPQHSFSELVQTAQEDLPPLWLDETSTSTTVAADSARDGANTIRHLTPSELAFLDKQRAAHGNKTQEEFWRAWLWPTMQTLVCLERDWQRGLVLGFIDEDDANALLSRAMGEIQQQQKREEHVGVFLLRFSEHNAGTLTLSYALTSGAEEQAKMVVLGKITLTVSQGTISGRRKDGSMTIFPNLHSAIASFEKLTHVLTASSSFPHGNPLPVREALYL